MNYYRNFNFSFKQNRLIFEKEHSEAYSDPKSITLGVEGPSQVSYEEDGQMDKKAQSEGDDFMQKANKIFGKIEDQFTTFNRSEMRVAEKAGRIENFKFTKKPQNGDQIRIQSMNEATYMIDIYIVYFYKGKFYYNDGVQFGNLNKGDQVTHTPYKTMGNENKNESDKAIKKIKAKWEKQGDRRVDSYMAKLKKRYKKIGLEWGNQTPQKKAQSKPKVVQKPKAAVKPSENISEAEKARRLKIENGLRASDYYKPSMTVKWLKNGRPNISYTYKDFPTQVCPVKVELKEIDRLLKNNNDYIDKVDNRCVQLEKKLMASRNLSKIKGDIYFKLPYKGYQKAERIGNLISLPRSVYADYSDKSEIKFKLGESQPSIAIKDFDKTYEKIAFNQKMKDFEAQLDDQLAILPLTKETSSKTKANLIRIANAIYTEYGIKSLGRYIESVMNTIYSWDGNQTQELKIALENIGNEDDTKWVDSNEQSNKAS